MSERKAGFSGSKAIEISLDPFEKKLAFKLGEGDLQLGVRRAVALAGLRMERNQPVKIKHSSEEADPLAIVINEMYSLAAALRELDDDPIRCEEITLQIMRLGKLYLTIAAGTDASPDDL